MPEITTFKKPAECKGCPLYSNAHVPYTKGTTNQYVIVAQSPGREEIIAQRPLVGQSGQLWNRVLAKVGIDRSQFFIANTLKCYEGNPTPNLANIKKAMTQCKFFLHRALTAVKPRLIIVSGAYALKAILGKEKITDKRGKMYHSVEYNCPVFVTLHPAAILRECSKDYPNQDYEMMSMREKDYLKDWQSIKQLLEYMKAKPDADIYWETTDAGSLDTTKFMHKLDTSGYHEGKLNSLKTFSKKPLSLDVETESATDLAKPLSISYSVEPKQSHVYRLGDTLEAEHRNLLEADNDKVVAGRPFDENKLFDAYGVRLGGKKYDVLTMAHILDENYYQFNLENVAAIHADMKDIKSLAGGMRTNLKEADWDTVVAYNGVDSDAALRSFNNMMETYEREPKLKNYLENFMLPVQDMQAAVARNGCKIDKKVYYESVVTATEEMRKLEETLIARIPASIKKLPAHQPDKSGKSKLRLSRDALLRDVIFTGFKCKPNERYVTAKNKLPQVSKEHLKDFKHIKWVSDYLDWAELEKLYSSYLSTLHGHAEVGYVYPSTSMIRTVTGRTAMVNPAIQTYPVRSKWSTLIRSCFIANKGWLLGSRDLSQSELRIAGWLANDENILRAVRNGIDLHTMTAAILNDIAVDAVTKEMRQKAKPINFGLIYGLSAPSLQAYLWEEYDLRVPIKECEQIRAKFFSYPNGYYGLLNFYSAIRNELRSKGYVESVLGRRRRFPQAKNSTEFLGRIERQAINHPVQSFSSDLALISMMLFWRAIQRYHLTAVVKPMWFIHDSIIFQAYKKNMKEAMELLKDCMEIAAPKYIKKYFDVDITYPVESEGKIGKSWVEI
jgi:DNA polymerase-1